MNSSHDRFPYLQHVSLLGTYTLLLGFTAIFLPRSTLFVASLPPQLSSLDKPQYEFLVPITASPVWTLGWLCAGVGVCQVWWGGWMRWWWSLGGGEGDGDGDVVSVVAHNVGGKLVALRDTWANTFVVSLLFHVVVVLFGAPITSHIMHTYLLALLASLLTVFVPAYTLSLPIGWSTDCLSSHVLLIARSGTTIERALLYPLLGAFLGAWAGAFPIPLDWDRPWQAWPLTPAYGAIAGHMTGAWLAVVVNVVLFFEGAGRESGSSSMSPVKKRYRKKAE